MTWSSFLLKPHICSESCSFLFPLFHPCLLTRDLLPMAQNRLSIWRCFIFTLSSSILHLLIILICWVLIVLKLLGLFMILLLLDKFLKHLLLMLSGNMIFENIFFHLLSTLRTLIQPLWAILQMHLHVTLFYSQTALLRALHFKLINDFLQAHVGLESLRKLYLTIRTFLGSQLAKAGLANDGSTLSTIIWRFWKIEANYAF